MYTNELLKPVMTSGLVGPRVELAVEDFINQTSLLELPPSVGVLSWRVLDEISRQPKGLYVYTFFPPVDRRKMSLQEEVAKELAKFPREDYPGATLEDSLLAEKANLFTRVYGIDGTPVLFYEVTGGDFIGIDHDATPLDFRKKINSLAADKMNLLAFNSPFDPRFAWTH